MAAILLGHRRRSIITMALCTVINDTGMVEHCGYESAAGYVADIAILIRWNVAGILADRTTSTAVMTGVTAFTHDFRAGMIDKCISEINGIMASTAIFVSGLMKSRICRTSGTDSNVICTSIVARSTITRDICVNKIVR